MRKQRIKTTGLLAVFMLIMLSGCYKEYECDIPFHCVLFYKGNDSTVFCGASDFATVIQKAIDSGYSYTFLVDTEYIFKTKVKLIHVQSFKKNNESCK